MKEIQKIIRQEIPVEFFIEWKNSLQQAYNHAVRNISNGGFEYPQAKNLLSYEYNAYADQNLKKIARRYPCFIIKDAKAENGYNYTILQTDSIIITQKAVASVNSMVDVSVSRQSLARGNSVYCEDQTQYLFPLEAMRNNPFKDKIYGILTHNRASVFSDNKDSFSSFAFPDPSFSLYIYNINLEEYCNNTPIIKQVHDIVAEIKDEVEPLLKISLKAEGMK